MGESLPDPAGAAGELMASLARKMGVEQVQYERVGEAALFLVDLGTLGFTGMDLNVFMITLPPRDDTSREAQLQLLREYASVVRTFGLCFHIILGPTPPSRDRLHLPEWHVVRIYREDLARIFSEPLPLSAFYALSRNQIDLSNLCPYNTTKVARGSMFVGRRRELHRLVDELDRDFVVGGARRIGKTSLLTRAFDELDRALNPRRRDHDAEAQPDNRRVFFFNGLNWKRWRDAARRITKEIEPKSEARVELNVTNLAKVIERQARRRHRPLLFFFDEFDEIADNDRAERWPFFSVMAEVMEARHARIVLAGYRSVPAIVDDRSSPLYDKLEVLELPALENKESHELIAPIMQNLGITLRHSNEFVQQIIADTANFPFMVQFFGQELFMKAAHSTGASLGPDDVNEVEARASTIDFIYRHYLDNTRDNDRIYALERACCLLYAKHLANCSGSRVLPDSWDVQNFLAGFDELGKELWEDEVHEALRNLTLAVILRNDSGRYSFALPMVPKMLKREYHDFDSAIRRFLR